MKAVGRDHIHFRSGGSRNTEYSGIITWGAALDYLMEIGIERMASYEEELLKKAEAVLEAIPQVKLLGIRNSGQVVYPFRSMVFIRMILQV